MAGKHRARKRPSRSKDRPKRSKGRWLLGASAGLLVIVLATGITVAVRRHGSSSSASADAAGPPAELDLLPASGSTDVALDGPVVVHITSGHLGAVTLAAPDGTAVAGALDQAGTTWRQTGELTPSTTYTLTADGTSPSGSALHAVSTFTSVQPSSTLTPTFQPSDGSTVGVGQPIVVKFDRAVTNPDALVQHLSVSMSQPVPGAWHWFSDKEVHFRPEDYWPSGEQVTVTADLNTYDNGGGVWGDRSHTLHFTIGDNHVSLVDLSAHTMTVTSNGQVVKTMPISGGRDKYPTMTGTHIAMYKQQNVLMDSSTVGIPRNSPDGYYEHVYWDVAITDGGEFVHAAPWSTGSQGRSNVSHGCVNISTADATWFFNYTQPGDIIAIVNGSRAPELDDHGVMDWSTPWNVWVPPVPTPTAHGPQ